jgi:hypothetical protein
MKTQLECDVGGSMTAVLARSVELHLERSVRVLSNTVCFGSHATQCLSVQAENCLGRLGHAPMNRTFRFSMLRIILFGAQTVLPRCATRRSTEVRDSVGHPACLRGALRQEKPIALVADNPDDILLTVRALQKNNFSNKAIVARAGKEALDYLFRTGPLANRATNHCRR